MHLCSTQVTFRSSQLVAHAEAAHNAGAEAACVDGPESWASAASADATEAESSIRATQAASMLHSRPGPLIARPTPSSHAHPRPQPAQSHSHAVTLANHHTRCPHPSPSTSLPFSLSPPPTRRPARPATSLSRAPLPSPQLIYAGTGAQLLCLGSIRSFRQCHRH